VAGGDFDPSELICGGCVPHSADATCRKHGDAYIEYKCRFCCSVAVGCGSLPSVLWPAFSPGCVVTPPQVFFCFGTTHFCDTCHSQPGYMQNQQSAGKLPPCPALPLCACSPLCIVCNAMQVLNVVVVISGKEGDPAQGCPLKVKHPPTGQEFALGCGLCKNTTTF
jgi:RCR-type E3 ubiquitin transferase